MSQGAPASDRVDLGAWQYWPEDPFWSFQFVRLVEQQQAGGADFAEIHSVAKDIPVGDGEAWYSAFKRLAEDVEGKAERAADAGHEVSARELWFRASNYHRSAGFFLSPGDGMAGETVIGRRRCFTAAAKRADSAIEPVEIPFEGQTLPGWVFSPAASVSRPTPTVIVFGGTDAVAEEMYFFIGKALTDRGYTVLAIDGPGQGEALRRGIRARHDFEVPVAAAIDFLEDRDDVDSDRLVLVGQSLGGYYAGRVAAFETRLKAVVVWGTVYDVHDVLRMHVDAGTPTGAHFIEVYRIMLGAADADEVFEKLKAFTLRGQLQQTVCPVLVVHGERDLLVPVADAYRTHDENPRDDKELIIYPTGEPGCTHCQVDALPLVHFDICNWLDEQLR